jgi:hypothetical protein
MTTWHRGRLVALLLLAGALAGCAGTRPYVSSSEDNLRFTTLAESGSWLSSVQASVHIHSVDENCQTNFEGTIRLGENSIATGIPVGQPSFLVFSFDSSSFLTNSSSSINYRTMLTPRRDHDYDIAVEYLDNTYNATIREVNRQDKQWREVGYTPLATCRA